MSLLDDPDAPMRGLSSRQMAFYRFSRNPLALIGAFIVLSVALAAIFAPLLAPSPESAGAFVDFRNRHVAPSWDHLMGTDNVGRDVLTRVIFGYRVSLMLVVGVLGVAVPFGIVLGLMAGYFGGWTETIIMRFTDVMLALPPLVMALAITAVLSPNDLDCRRQSHTGAPFAFADCPARSPKGS